LFSHSGSIAGARERPLTGTRIFWLWRFGITLMRLAAAMATLPGKRLVFLGHADAGD